MRTRTIRRTVATAAVAVTGAVLAPIGVPAAQAGDPTPTGDAYVPMSPCRIVDTRQAGGALGDREIRDFFVSGDLAFEDQGGRAGGCDIPIGVSAIEASVTAVDPDDSGFFRAWPPAEAMPNATFMNFDEGMDITNTGSIALNPTYLEEPGANDVGGLYQLRVRNFGGSSHYVIDVQGYWIDPSMADEPTFYTAITPCRALDTRQVAEPDYIVEDRDTLPLNFTTPSSYELQGGKAGGCGIPYEAVGLETAVSAVDPEGSGFTRAWPANSSPPNATFLNYDTGMDITNTASLAIDPFTGPPSQATTSDLNPIELYLRNFGSSTHYVMDIQGYFTPIPTDEGATTAAQTPTSGYVPITPCRILDTRQAGGSLGDREIRDVVVTVDGLIGAQGGKAGGCDIPGGIAAVEASVTAVDPLDSGFFRAWPSNESMPNATFMNFDEGMDITNTGSLTVESVASFGAIAEGGDPVSELRIRNFGGRSHYVIDVQGYYPSLVL